jgi:hypothetical protein
MDGASPAAIMAVTGERPASENETIADNLLEGCPAIGAFIGKSARETLWAIERGRLPAWRDGHKWCALKSVLRQHYAELATKVVDPTALAKEREGKNYARRSRTPSLPQVSMEEAPPKLRRRRVA